MRRSSPTKLTKASYEALADFRFALRAFLAFSEKAALEAGLTAQQHQAMLAIRAAPEGEPLSVGAIAGRLLVRHHTAVELVDRLALMGMVARETDRHDKRRILVSLTKRGHAAIDELSSIHIEELRSICPTLRKLLQEFETKRLTGKRTHNRE
jgi:DNA-binding MarR family transcriptional regulator